MRCKIQSQIELLDKCRVRKLMKVEWKFFLCTKHPEEEISNWFATSMFMLDYIWRAFDHWEGSSSSPGYMAFFGLCWWCKPYVYIQHLVKEECLLCCLFCRSMLKNMLKIKTLSSKTMQRHMQSLVSWVLNLILPRS